jgi:hypothetical protein
MHALVRLLLANRRTDSPSPTPIRHRIAQIGQGDVHLTVVGGEPAHVSLTMPDGREYLVDTDTVQLPTSPDVGLEGGYTLADAAALIADIESGALRRLLEIASDYLPLPLESRAVGSES